jgi:hypothetical protein
MVTDRNLVRLAAGCAVLLAAGCGGAAREAAAAPVSAHPAHTAGSLTAVQRRVLAARYLAIAQPANRWTCRRPIPVN